jgi:hypothetical protein
MEELTVDQMCALLVYETNLLEKQEQEKGKDKGETDGNSNKQWDLSKDAEFKRFLC